MKIKFIIPFNTHLGQEVYIYGSIKELGEFDSNKAIRLSYKDGEWYKEIDIITINEFKYSYFLKEQNGYLKYESGSSRSFVPIVGVTKYVIKDEWKPFTSESPFLSCVFKNILYGTKSKEKVYKQGDITITCSANNISDDKVVKISGNTKILGNWDPKKTVKMFKNKDGNFEVSLNRSDFKTSFEYKFLISDETGKIFTIWENGNNRFLDLNKITDDTHYFVNHFSINLEAEKPRVAGTAIPLFSIRSEDSCGIGDFGDIPQFVEFLHSTKQFVLQLLPLNDTTMNRTWSDSYPYGAISIFALHPIYLSTNLMGKLKNSKFLSEYNKECQKLNSLEFIDYDNVLELKWKFFEKIYEQEGENKLKSKEYIIFYEKNKSWLDTYAAFCYLRDKNKTPDFRTWKEHSIYDKSEIQKLITEHQSEIQIHHFLQFELHLQLQKAHDYANSKGVALKGDIPIGVNRNSVEAWSEPHLFNFNGQAGAPPDDFSIRGQNWGFPTYNWDIMEKDGYKWWKDRFTKMSEYFDAYRIDHILGFFRIWEVPQSGIEGILGHFNPSLPLSIGELNNYGYSFDYERDCKPYIKEHVLDSYFGLDKNRVIESFLEISSWQSYKFKPEFDTQRKLEKYFIENPNSDLVKHNEGLLSLYTEILFIQDPIDHNRYHPRISAQYTKSFKDLNTHQQEKFNSIYNHFYYHRNDHYWHHLAMRKLPSLITSNNMLVCGEDLGMIPNCVPKTMRELSILSLEIQRMPKDPKVRFGDPKNYPYLSVCSTGTHDTSTLRAWWEENVDLSKNYYYDYLGNGGDLPLYCEPWICKQIILDHLNSPSMLAIFPLQDWLSINSQLRRENPNDERINVPSNPKHYWRYRMHLTIEELNKQSDFKNEIIELINNSGRAII